MFDVYFIRKTYVYIFNAYIYIYMHFINNLFQLLSVL